MPHQFMRLQNLASVGYGVPGEYSEGSTETKS
jgi:hypothetical protein